MDQSKLNIVIVGLGNISKTYIECIKKNKYAKLVAVCDISKKKLNEIKLQESNIKTYTSVKKLIDNNFIDLAIITSFSGLHYEHTKQFILSGINTLTEKPITLKLSDAKNLIRLSKKYKVSSGVVFQNRFNKSVQYLNNLILNNKISNKVTASVRIRWCRDNKYYSTPWRGSWKLDGGVIAQQAVHHIDIMQLICGKPKKIFAIKNKRLNNLEAEDTCVGVVEFEDGLLCTIEATTSARPIDYEASFTLLFDKGLINIGGIALNKISQINIKGKTIKQLKDIQKKYSEEFKSPLGNGHKKLFDETISRLLIKDLRPVISIEESLKSLRIIHSIYSSTEKNIPIKYYNNISSRKLGK